MHSVHRTGSLQLAEMRPSPQGNVTRISSMRTTRSIRVNRRQQQIPNLMSPTATPSQQRNYRVTANQVVETTLTEKGINHFYKTRSCRLRQESLG